MHTKISKEPTILRRPQVLGSIEATSIVTRGGCSLRGMRPCHHGRRTLAVTQAAGKQPFTAPDCDGPDLVSDPVIVDGIEPITVLDLLRIDEGQRRVGNAKTT